MSMEIGNDSKMNNYRNKSCVKVTNKKRWIYKQKRATI